MSAISCSLGTWPVVSSTRIIERNRMVVGLLGRGAAERFRRLIHTTNDDPPNRQGAHREGSRGCNRFTRGWRAGHTRGAAGSLAREQPPPPCIRLAPCLPSCGAVIARERANG